jgi:2-phospho-L-lactate guanylyltransferase
MPSPTVHPYAVVVPVKPPAFGKSRLLGLGNEVRRTLVTAFALDTVAAALASPLVRAVLAVTDDPALSGALAEAGAEVMPDPAVLGDLNGSLRAAAAEVARRWHGRPLAVLCADLPALRSEDLTSALRSASRSRASFVADAAGVGTTLLTAPRPGLLHPCFGSGSRRAHQAAGAVELEVAAVSSLRRDVDTPEDLEAALLLGVGAETARALHQASRSP